MVNYLARLLGLGKKEITHQEYEGAKWLLKRVTEDLGKVENVTGYEWNINQRMEEIINKYRLTTNEYESNHSDIELHDPIRYDKPELDAWKELMRLKTSADDNIRADIEARFQRDNMPVGMLQKTEDYVTFGMRRED
ncbi:hypothetical protein D4Q76_01310 [archaeon]|nr:MAG: hypothetical protein D4Q76_01310 [archaeon]